MSAVPEPAGWAMMLFGVGGLGAAMRRSRLLLPKSPISCITSRRTAVDSVVPVLRRRLMGQCPL